MSLNKKIHELSRKLGVNYFGVSDLSSAKDFIIEQGGNILSDFKYCISIGLILPNTLIDQLPFRSNRAVAVNYRFHAYEIINHRLDHDTSILSNFVQELGYHVMPIPAAERYDDERICAVFSHKLGAHLAGLGWIGKSCLLITPNHGPRVRWSSILADAPLKPTGKPMGEKCGACLDCVKICPMNAFSGRSFDPKEPREMRYDALKCQDYFISMTDKGEIPVCGMCLYACPYGRKNS
ncbi:MAG: 4Fe-4S double cluster binding domain-containing protein [Thermodesulfobacteriota bacterium]|jgi:epoxyqueuosine reductase QueG